MGKLKQGIKSSKAYPKTQYIGRNNIDQIIVKQIREIEEEIVNRSENKNKHIINIYGESGIGKTTTQKHIIESLFNSDNKYWEERRLPLKYLYFDLNREYLDKYSFIIRVIDNLRSRYSMNDFICTTCAMYMISKYTGRNFDIDLLSIVNEHINKKATKLALKTADSIKGVSEFIKLTEIIISSDKKTNKEITDAFTKLAEITSAKSLDYVKNIIGADCNTIDDNLILYFVQDLRMLINKLSTPIIFCIDSFDIQTVGTPLRDLEIYLRELAEELPYTLWIISGRECFSKVVSGWEKLDVLNIELLPFTESIVKEYVENANLPNEVSILFYKLSKGNPCRLRQLHLKCVDLIKKNDNYLDEDKY